MSGYLLGSTLNQPVEATKICFPLGEGLRNNAGQLARLEKGNNHKPSSDGVAGAKIRFPGFSCCDQLNEPKN